MNSRTLFFFLVLISSSPSRAAPYFISQNEYETRSERSSFHAWPLTFFKSSAGYFLDEEKTFLERAVVVKPIKKISALCLDRNLWVTGQWVDITEPYPPLSPSEMF